MRRLVLSVLMASFWAYAEASTSSPMLEEITGVRWNVTSTVFGDFTCSGKKDIAMYGTSEKSGYVVMIQPAKKGAKPSYLVFPDQRPDPSSIEFIVESLDVARDKALQKELRFAAPTFRSSKKCKGLLFRVGDTDAKHIFWDRRARAFKWWSL
jgi:hypothetical protein